MAEKLNEINILRFLRIREEIVERKIIGAECNGIKAPKELYDELQKLSKMAETFDELFIGEEVWKTIRELREHYQKVHDVDHFQSREELDKKLALVEKDVRDELYIYYRDAERVDDPYGMKHYGLCLDIMDC